MLQDLQMFNDSFTLQIVCKCRVFISILLFWSNVPHWSLCKIAVSSKTFVSQKKDIKQKAPFVDRQNNYCSLYLHVVIEVHSERD